MKIGKKIFITSFIILICVPQIVWALLYLTSRDLYESLNAGPDEKRNAQALVFDDIGDVGNVLSAYVDDHAPFRGALITLCQKIETGSENIYIDAVSALTGSGSDSQMSVDLDALDALGGTGTSSGSEDAGGTQAQADLDYKLVETVFPTCTEEGYERYVCDETGDSYVTPIPANGHDGTLIEVSESSYTTWGYEKYECSVCGRIYYENIVPKLVDTSYLAPRTSGGSTIFGRFDWLFFMGNDSLSYYKGTNLLSEEELADYAARVQRLQELCDERGIELYFMFIPNKEQVYSEYMPSYEVETEHKRVEVLTDYLRENTDATVLYPLAELRAGDFYHQTYSRYDTHWNLWGGFIGVQLLYNAMGRETIDIADAAEMAYPFPSERNDLILLGGLDATTFPEDTDYLVDYKPEVLFFLDSYDPVAHFTSTSENEEYFVLVGDSFLEMLRPYITRDYMHTLYLRRTNEYACREDILNADILVVETVERYDGQVYESMEALIDILENGDP
ncbi:MAG: hypothetical protein K5871_03250 [Lachnospiraceae bacterium]|nr:hypothetical protein [Lachnospiraceae bacterium]